MTVKNIIKQVRWCIDKETQKIALLDSQVQDDVYLDNLIKAHIADAIFWCCYYGSSNLLNATTAEDDGFIQFISNPVVVKKEDGLYGEITLSDKFVKLVRVRMEGWHKAISADSLIAEDSDEYLKLRNKIAKATEEEPAASIVNSIPKRLEIYPYEEKGEVTLALTTLNADDPDFTDDDTNVNIPYTIRSAFFYYIAFLVLSAYSDSNASAMLNIAKMNIGITSTNNN